MNKNKESGKSSWFIETLQLIFITLRLCGVIDWNWIWVLCPLWGALTLAVILIGIGYVSAKIRGGRTRT